MSPHQKLPSPNQCDRFWKISQVALGRGLARKEKMKKMKRTKKKAREEEEKNISSSFCTRAPLRRKNVLGNFPRRKCSALPIARNRLNAPSAPASLPAPKLLRIRRLKRELSAYTFCNLELHALPAYIQEGKAAEVFGPRRASNHYRKCIPGCRVSRQQVRI